MWEKTKAGITFKKTESSSIPRSFSSSPSARLGCAKSPTERRIWKFENNAFKTRESSTNDRGSSPHRRSDTEKAEEALGGRDSQGEAQAQLRALARPRLALNYKKVIKIVCHQSDGGLVYRRQSG